MRDQLSPSRAILYGTLAVGVLDILHAFLVWGLRGVPPVRILQSIAAGLLGRSAYDGGAATAVLGAALHFFIAFSIVSAYHLASRGLPALTRKWLPCGLVYGVLVYFFMNQVVIPLSALGRPKRFSMVLFLNGVIGHALLVGAARGVLGEVDAAFPGVREARSMHVSAHLSCSHRPCRRAFRPAVGGAGTADFAAVREALRRDLGRGDWEGVHERIRLGLEQALRDSDATAAAGWRSEAGRVGPGTAPVPSRGAAARDGGHHGGPALRCAGAPRRGESRPRPALLPDAFETRDWVAARGQVEKARTLWQAAGRADRLGDVHNYLGLIELQQGRLEPAEAEFRKALDLARDAGDENVASSVERHLGFVHQRRGARAAALEMYERSLRGRERLGATVTVPFARIAVAELLLDWRRDPERAASLLRDAADLAHRSGSPRAEYTARRRLASLAVAAGKRATARRELDAALAAARAFGSPDAIEGVLSERSALDRVR